MSDIEQRLKKLEKSRGDSPVKFVSKDWGDKIDPESATFTLRFDNASEEVRSEQPRE